MTLSLLRGGKHPHSQQEKRDWVEDVLIGIKEALDTHVSLALESGTDLERILDYLHDVSTAVLTVKKNGGRTLPRKLDALSRSLSRVLATPELTPPLTDEERRRALQFALEVTAEELARLSIEVSR